ncbi:EAL domain-containing protein [Alteromonas pelagimontana]|uniref:EAL domain-containing protein n=1 Tax=Alteromonas pelagimontana TaxID=1858656 RepID=A0A6M4M9Z0_9ALTE|nr:EAL domain-containing protein [Alteromonas pelagimontana]QJR79500.1 EAL domain-containing protein [Alteromonas pelagimontana]
MSLLKNKRVLVVEDTTIAATYLARELSNMGANVVGLARSEEQALQMVEKTRPELILMDIHLAEGGSGIDAAKVIARNYSVPLIYTTSFSDDSTLSRALETSPYGYVVKPFDAKTIKVTCETALSRFALEQKIASSEKRFRVAAEAAQFGVLELDESGKAFTFKGAKSLKNRFGAGTEMSREDFLGLFPANERQAVVDTLEKRSSLRKTIQFTDQETEGWVDIVFTEVDLKEDNVVIGAVIDVTDKQRQIKKLQLSNVILDQLVEGVAVLDEAFCVIDVNTALLGLLRIEQSALMGTNIFEFGFDQQILNKVHQLKPPKPILREKTMLLRSDGIEFPAFVTFSELESKHEKVQYVVTISDITDLSRAEKKLEALAFTDQLTGAGNRNYLKLILNENVYAGSVKALLFIDIDGFKLVNDSYGHDVGDDLLAECAARIKAVIRQNDTFIRHGGDEFIILVQETSDLAQLSERLLAVFEKQFSINNKTLKIGASIGVAESSPGITPSEMLKHADIAMYEAKKRGKNQVVFFSSQQNESIEYRLFVEQGLYNAIVNQDLYASFQPIVDSEENIVALEALCRWNNIDIGHIHPESFIPIAEETGLINALGLKMLREVCIANVLLREAGMSHIKLHVNVSILQLNSQVLVDQFLAYLKDFDVSPKDIVLEVTETAMHDNSTKRILRELAKSGFGIAIDDFGAGFASVSELTEPYTTMVKLDKSLAPTGDVTNTRNVIAESLIQLCQKLGKTVLLEGIEKEIQADFARQAGCHYMQGFLFAKPMSLTEAMQRITQKEAQAV